MNKWSKTTGVYRIKNVLNGHCYVGSSSALGSISHRISAHINALKKGKHHSPILQRAWNKYGEDGFVVDILEECSRDLCLEREQHYLDTLRPFYNIYQIAGSPKGRIVSDETKQKISTSLMGRSLSDKHKDNISLSLKGIPKTKEHSEKARTALIGKRKVGRDSGRFAGCWVFVNTETSERFIGGQFELSKKYDLNLSNISKICLGKRRLYKKWICLGKESYEE